MAIIINPITVDLECWGAVKMNSLAFVGVKTLAIFAGTILLRLIS
jgi:hypothetical protein